MPVPEGFPPEQAAALQLQMQAIQPVLPTPEKRWYDRVVDSILGDDPCKRNFAVFSALADVQHKRHIASMPWFVENVSGTTDWLGANASGNECVSYHINMKDDADE